MDALEPTHIAYLMVAFQQMVLTFGWLVGAAFLPAVLRPAASYWAAHAAAAGLALLMFIYAASEGAAVARVVGNVLAVVSVLALQRGMREFTRRASSWAAGGVVLAAAAAMAVAGAGPSHAVWRVGAISALLCVLSLWVARDVFVHLRRQFQQGAVAGLLVLPLLLAAAVLAVRAVWAVFADGALTWHDSGDSVSAAAVLQVLMLVFQLTLLGMVVAHLTDDLRRASRHDMLTGLLNRSATDQALADEVQRARRLKHPFSVLMIDADRFKDLNDSYGHAAGDRALQHLATLMSAQMRDIDRLGRWGGEEFVAVLPASEIAEATVLAERLRERVAALPLHAAGHTMRMTVSVGVAQWRGDSESPQDLLQRADEAMYRAKSAGRNRVEAEPL